MPLKDYLDVGKDAAETALQFPFGPSTALNAAPGGEWEGMADIAGNVGMGALELGNLPFEAAGEAIRGAGESEPLKMATAEDQSGFRWPSIVQRLAPSTRTDHPPSDPFMKSYQGLEGLVNLPRGIQAASDVVTGPPDVAAQLGGLGLGLGVTPWHPERLAKPEMPQGLMNERGGLTLGSGSEPSPAQLPAASPWHSRLTNTLQEKLPEKADVGQIKNIMATLPKEEQDVRGLTKFMEGKLGQVEKKELMEFLEQNQVKLGEKTIGGGENAEVIKRIKEIDRLNDSLAMPDTELLDERDILSKQLEEQDVSKYNSPKFESYTQPGGENYRELYITMPEKSPQPFDEWIKHEAYTPEELNSPERMELAREGYENVVKHGGARESFEVPGAHAYGDPDVDKNQLVRILAKDFVDPQTGKKTLMVSEAQSDWHQKGAAEGYGDQVRIVGTRNGVGFLEDLPNIEEAQARSSVLSQEPGVELESIGSKTGVPNAPFKNNWHELSFKRALREAVDGGYDELAWSTGSDRAAQYNLEKQVKHIAWEKNDDGTFNINAPKPNGEPGIYKEDLTPDDLGELVGKDIATKIVEGHGTSSGESPYRDWHILEGENLKVGGDFLKGLYDKKIPSFVNKYLKKYGVQVEDGLLPSGRQMSTMQGGGRLKPGSFAVTNSRGDFIAGFPTEKEALKWGYENHIPDFSVKPNDIIDGVAIHKIKITPEMKTEIQAHGQPMWKVPAMIGAGAAGAANAEADQQEFSEGGIVEEEDQDMQMNQGGDWKDDLAGYMDEHFRGKEQAPRNMASGGIFGDDFDVNVGDSSTVRGAPFAPPTPSEPPRSSRPIFNPMNGLPPPAAPLKLAPASTPAPVAPAPTPAASSGPDPLQGYLSEQRAALNRYGPEEQMALEEKLHRQRTGFVPVMASAATGLADAIMQGVARAGPSNFQSNLENRMDKTQDAQRQAMGRAQTGHLARMKQEMELAQIDPTSPISRLAQRSATPLLIELGLTDDEIRNIPASLIGEAQTKRLSLEDIRTKAEETRALREQNALLQGQGLDLRRETAEEAARKARVEEAEKVKGRRLGAAKDLLTKSGNARAWGIPIPFTSDISSEDKEAALAVLREGMEPDQGTVFEPDVLEYAKTHNITPEQAQIQKQRRLQKPQPTGAQ